MPQILKIGSTNVIELTRHNDAVTGLPLADSVVTFDLVDKDDQPVAGAQAVQMPYDAGPPAAYRGVVNHTVALTPGPYTANVTATNAGNVRRFPIDCVAEY